MKGLDGKVALVAGGGGMGEPTARRLAGEGASVVIADLNGARAEEVAAEIVSHGGRASGIQFDISDEASVAKVFAEVTNRHGGVDLMFANAADLSMATQGADTTLLEAPIEVFDRTIAVDLRGHVLCTRLAVPSMLERGGGAIVYTASTAAHLGSGRHPYYAAAKAGLLALMRHVAAVYGSQGIRSNAVSPGMILTDLAIERTPPEEQAAHLRVINSPRIGVPEDIAAIVTFLLSDECGFLQGATIDVNGGLLKR